MTEGRMSYEQFRNALDHALLDELETLRAHGHLTRDGLLATRSRLTEAQEFGQSPARDLLLANVEAALEMTRSTPDDVGDLAEPDELPEPEP
jgi:hypothetical protein